MTNRLTNDRPAGVNDLLRLLDESRQREAALREALEYISFASNGYPVVHLGQEVPEEWQALLRAELRHMGEQAEQALRTADDLLPLCTGKDTA